MICNEAKQVSARRKLKTYEQDTDWNSYKITNRTAVRVQRRTLERERERGAPMTRWRAAKIEWWVYIFRVYWRRHLKRIFGRFVANLGQSNGLIVFTDFLRTWAAINTSFISFVFLLLETSLLLFFSTGSISFNCKRSDWVWTFGYP